ncbi:MAG: M23 family metallopeptidase [Candidatus Marinimicrobia bacterium]|nr:M23 family metallopeptidase [Candidatus Neomarinimicrobiota bacterium]MBL7011151.1 M23 family metallopeptidase [Candidatus Neomarinimicrobiota bacterium]MBL7031377.1 M23 family metallopeptidase [Candidatus Neomarinimicrobiota bacterium]
MKPSRYTFLIVPDHDGENKRYSFSRTTVGAIIILVIIIFSGMIVSLVVLAPKAFDHQRMESRYNELIGERTKVLELYRDLERLKQMEMVVQKALGTDLDKRKIGDRDLNKIIENEPLKYGYLDHIPSLMPVKGYVTQKMIEDENADNRLHYGVDIAVGSGAPVMASGGGQVVFAGMTTELGNLVVIYHGNNYFTYYGHNELLKVDQYQNVDRGDIIATIGSSGKSSGPHLHFEIWKEGKAVDPLLYFPELNKTNMSVD